MIIKKLELVNFQVIKEFHADFEGNIYFIKGDNELGKSTLLKAIGVLLTGERDEVLRAGEKKGYAKAIIGKDGNEYEVELRYTEANPRCSIVIKNTATGMKTEQVTMLQKIFGYVDFDAVEFSRWSETADGRRKQVEAVKKLLPQSEIEKIAEIENSIPKLREQRKEANSEVKTYKVLAEQAKKKLGGDETPYTEKIDITECLAKQQEQMQLEAKAETMRKAIVNRQQQLSEIDDKIIDVDNWYEKRKKELEQRKVYEEESYRKKLAELKEAHEASMTQIDEQLEVDKQHAEDEKENIRNEEQDLKTRKQNAEMWLYEYSKQPKVDYADKISQAQAYNEKCDMYADYQAKLKDLAEKEREAERLDEEIKQALAAKKAIIDNSSLPIEGLSFTDEGLTLNDIPFVPGKVSDSQIMEVAVKLIIASNPTVSVFRIARGESLGEKRLQDIINIAKEHGFQGFIEEVKRGQNDLIIEEYTEK